MHRDSSHHWSAVMDGYTLIRKDNLQKWGDGVALCMREHQEGMELYLGMADAHGWCCGRCLLESTCSGKKKQIRSTSDNWKKLYFGMPWPSWGTSGTLISIGGLMQQRTRNSGIFWNVLMTISWHRWLRSQRGEKLCCSWHFHRKTGWECESWEQPRLLWPWDHGVQCV